MLPVVTLFLHFFFDFSFLQENCHAAYCRISLYLCFPALQPSFSLLHIAHKEQMPTKRPSAKVIQNLHVIPLYTHPIFCVFEVR